MTRLLWTQRQNIGPAARIGHALADDSDRGRVVLFGGTTILPGLMHDTWEWDGENWTQMSDFGPSARTGHALVYDSVRHETVLFGGQGEGGPLGDTWIWSGEAWTQVADSGPPARAGHALACDSARGRVILFGGEAGAGLLNDTWEWDGRDWTLMAEAGPPARTAHAFAYDLRRRRAVLFGGRAANARGLGDTWAWDGATWTLMADFGPAPRLAAAFVYQTGRGTLFGGLDTLEAEAQPTLFQDTHEWDGKRWTQRQNFGPGPRRAHAMAFDRRRRRIVLFGGCVTVSGPPPVEALLGDTWELPTADPPAIQSLALSVAQVDAGQSVAGTVTLDGAAQADLIVQLESRPPGAGVFTPERLSIPAGAVTGEFALITAAPIGVVAPGGPPPGGAAGPYQIVASLDLIEAAAPLMVIPGPPPP